MNNAIINYFNSVKGRRIAFCGLGRSNLPLINMYRSFGANVIACDKRTPEQLGEVYDNLVNDNVELSLGEDYLKDLNADVLFRTPGMNYNMTELKELRNKGVVVTSEMETFFELCPCKIIAVTGSDGKTTTTTIISELLKSEGKTVHLGGNIGNPLLPDIMNINEDDYAVVELSSFQLISMKRSPDIAVVTNVTPNHLDVHKDMQEYIDAKFNILKYQSVGNVAVLNFANEITKDFADSIASDVRFFNVNSSHKDCIFLENNNIYYKENNNKSLVLDSEDIAIPGAHNIENYMAAISAVWGIVSLDTINKVAKTFGGVAHRAELVREISGVRYYNDSIASSPTRTIRGTLSLFDKKIILICGGYDKNIPYAPLGPVINEKVKVLVLLGATAPKIEEAVKTADNFSDELMILHADSMENAVALASENSEYGDIISLSPASASFDMYRDFEERGNHFKSIVNSL